MDDITTTELQPEVMTDDAAPDFSFATVAEVCADGLALIFDGETEAGEKHYKCNTAVPYAAGDRVKVCKDSGTYVVEYVVGAPGGAAVGNHIPAGGSDGQILQKDGSTDYTLKWGSNPIPAGGSTGQMLVKSSAANYDVSWAPPATNHIPSGGSDGQLLAKSGTTNYSLTWVSAPHGIPAGGTTGQILVKSGPADYAVGWAAAPTGLPTGGSTGQVLTKTSTTNFAVSWQTPSAAAVAKLTSGSYTLTLSSKNLAANSTGFSIGSSSYPLALYSNAVYLRYNAYTGCTLSCNSSGKFCVNGTVVT